ncbi:hypothetical protein PR048_006592 [Dryococelus australis]|uniref:Reverse transcriptase domain-containing protein n=1 Tax=Dryococelus australis TaxID=614101 RepID=A0ABQ9IBH1_9NEOP|nr:hypothetical protein PR048_006592 [Dryococelus australis]
MNQRKVKSYRPITLLPVMGKMLEPLINRRLIEYINVVQGIHPKEYGFMKWKSTEMAVMDMVEQKADVALKKIEGWAERFKMDLSVEKINGILLKGNLKRNLVIRFWGRLIKRVTEMKYLGAILESRIAFHAHVRYVVNNGVVKFQRLRAVAPAN